jgi:hypothetical protein
MGDVFFRQELSVSAARLPAIAGDPVTQKDFEIVRESFDMSDYSEDSASRFNIPANTPNVVLGMGTVSKASVLVIRPETEIKLIFVTSDGDSLPIKLYANKTSVLHAEFIGLKLAQSTDAMKGKYFVLGE